MKDRFLINFYKDGVISSQQRFLGERSGAERLAEAFVKALANRGILASYEIIKL